MRTATCKRQVQPGPKLRDSEPSAEKASGDFQPEPTDCKICDELDQDIKEAEEEGPRLFKELLVKLHHQCLCPLLIKVPRD